MKEQKLDTPKAEVTGSNPVGCANLFNGLGDICPLAKSHR
jgi:hypothetical protein